MRGSYSMGQPTQAGPPAASVGPLDPDDDRGSQLFTSSPAARKADPTDPLWITAMTQASNARERNPGQALPTRTSSPFMPALGRRGTFARCSGLHRNPSPRGRLLAPAAGP